MAAGVMDGRGRWMDNVFIERLWRSLKYEDIYLKGYGSHSLLTNFYYPREGSSKPRWQRDSG
jgi:hypothetical protein